MQTEILEFPISEEDKAQWRRPLWDFNIHDDIFPNLLKLPGASREIIPGEFDILDYGREQTFTINDNTSGKTSKVQKVGGHLKIYYDEKNGRRDIKAYTNYTWAKVDIDGVTYKAIKLGPTAASVDARNQNLNRSDYFNTLLAHKIKNPFMRTFAFSSSSSPLSYKMHKVKDFYPSVDNVGDEAMNQLYRLLVESTYPKNARGDFPERLGQAYPSYWVAHDRHRDEVVETDRDMKYAKGILDPNKLTNKEDGQGPSLVTMAPLTYKNLLHGVIRMIIKAIKNFLHAIGLYNDVARTPGKNRKRAAIKHSSSTDKLRIHLDFKAIGGDTGLDSEEIPIILSTNRVLSQSCGVAARKDTTSASAALQVEPT